MRFLFKLVIFGFLGLLVLPTFSPLPEQAIEQEPELALAQTSQTAPSFDAMRIAIGFAGDISKICMRDPELCEAGGRLTQAAIGRAKEGAMVLAKMVEQHRAEQTDPKATGSIQ